VCRVTFPGAAHRLSGLLCFAIREDSAKEHLADSKGTVLLGMSKIDTKSPSQTPSRSLRVGYAVSRRRRHQRALLVFAIVLLSWNAPTLAHAQLYAGILGGVSSLSGDARSIVNSDSSAFSSYDPKNGGDVSVLFGKHFSEYLSAQVSYTWNENELSLAAGSSGTGMQQAYQQTRSSSQQTAIGNVLVYFRQQKSRLRPYLSVGTGFMHFASKQETLQHVFGVPALPPQQFSANAIVLNVPVGIDVNLGKGWAFRYTFSETISGNPISERLSPPGLHTFKNFQNLFGFVRRF